MLPSSLDVSCRWFNRSGEISVPRTRSEMHWHPHCSPCARGCCLFLFTIWGLNELKAMELSLWWLLSGMHYGKQKSIVITLPFFSHSNGTIRIEKNAWDFPKCSPGRSDTAFGAYFEARAIFIQWKYRTRLLKKRQLQRNATLKKKENNRVDIIGRFASLFVVEYCPGVRSFMISRERIYFWFCERKCEAKQYICTTFYPGRQSILGP